MRFPRVIAENRGMPTTLNGGGCRWGANILKVETGRCVRSNNDRLEGRWQKVLNETSSNLVTAIVSGSPFRGKGEVTG